MGITDRLLFGVIFLTGLTVMYTDLRERRIYNRHLLAAAVAGIIILAFAVIVGHENRMFHIVNAVVAMVAGAVLFYVEVWRGGDAKLFALLAFLMPLTGYEEKFFSSGIILFALSFFIGIGVLLPTLVWDVIRHRVLLAKTLVSTDKRTELWNGFLSVLMISWVLFPVMFVMKVMSYSKEFYLVLFVLCMLMKKTVRFSHDIVRKPWLIVLIVAIGLVARAILAPGMLSILPVAEYLIRMLLTTLCFVVLMSLISLQKEYQDRFPFAVLLFCGCLLSFTPVLGWFMALR